MKEFVSDIFALDALLWMLCFGCFALDALLICIESRARKAFHFFLIAIHFWINYFFAFFGLLIQYAKNGWKPE
jgi:hypothetical protein